VRRGRRGEGSSLEEPPLREAGGIVAGDNDVIEDSNIDEGEGLLDALGDHFVCLGRFGDSARVVVGQDDGGGVMFESFLEDFAGVYGGAVDGAAEEVLASDQAMARVEVDQRKHLMRALRESGHQVVSGRSRRAQCRASADFAGNRLSCTGHDYNQARSQRRRCPTFHLSIS